MEDFKDFKFSFYTLYPLTSDKLVELSEARHAILAKAIASGTASATVFADVEEFLIRKSGTTQDEYRELCHIGMWIAWDREVRDLSDEEKEAYWKKYDLNDPENVEQIDRTLDDNPELQAEMEQFHVGLMEHLQRRRSAFNNIINNVNES